MPEALHLPTPNQAAENSPHRYIQSFAYESDGVDFWGIQYHPEFTPAWVADLMRAPGTIWQNSETADLLDIADSDIDAAKQLGVRGKDLAPEIRTTEIRNWLLHIGDKNQM